MRASAFAIETKGLTKEFGDIRAVDRLSLTVNAGEMFALVGPDGAGKTTTIRMLCGILKPTAGEAFLFDHDLSKEAAESKNFIGYLSQRFSLYGDLTVDENIEFFAEIHKVADYKVRREELLEFTRLKSFRDRLADRLSGGMKQKLALACTLIHTPRILFLDEPTAGVDPVSRRDFWKILSNLLKSGITIFMSTPYLDEAERCSKVGLINNGRLMASDTPQAIKRLMKGEVVEVVCGEIRRAFGILKNLAGEGDVQIFGDRLNIILADARKDFPSLEARLNNAGIKIFDWRIMPPSLENVFISIMRSLDPEVDHEKNHS